MPLNDLADDQLMLAYVAGNVAAFDVLYARHQGSLFRFVRRLLGDALAAQADEVFQECWLRVVKARASFRPDSGASWKTWAFTIAHNLAMDRLRVSGRERSLDALERALHPSENGDLQDPLEWLQCSLNASHPNTEDVAFWRAAGQQMLMCLETLPTAQRAAFLLHHEDGASVEELAQALNLGFETAKSRLRYALQKLRGCMKRYLIVMETPA